MGELQIVVFSLNKEMCGVDTANVQEIIKYKDVIKVARMPKFIEGAIDYRGIMVPVINLNSRFGFGDTEYTKKTKIIIAKVSEILLGFIVNDVPGIFKLSEEEFEPAPDIIKQAGNVYLKNVAKLNGNLISVVDTALILEDKELKKLEILENKLTNAK